MHQMNRYEKENAIESIDGYFNSPPHFTEENVRRAFCYAKEQFRMHRLRSIECVDAISFEDWLSANAHISSHLSKYSMLESRVTQ